MTESNLVRKWKEWSPYLLSILRIVAAIMFMFHGTMKLFGYPAGMSTKGGTVDLFSEMGLAGILEAVGGAMLVLGLFTRPVAFLLAGQMAVAYFQAHASRALLPVANGGELAVVYCFLWLYFSAAGAGPWSIDAKMKK